MRLGTLRDGSRDGRLIVVDHGAHRYGLADSIAPHLQGALDDWSRAQPALQQLADAVNAGTVPTRELDLKQLHAPLPRAYEWIDGSAYLNHVRLVRKARGVEPPGDLETDPLVYQGGSGTMRGPSDALVLPNADWGLDFESEICLVVGDVPQGTSRERAPEYARLLMLANDVTYRNLIPAELGKGFGFFVSKPSTAFAPFAVTPDELGPAFADGRAFLRLRSTYNDQVVGDLDTGPEMHFSFSDLLAHVTQSRALTAGTILGSGTVSSSDRTRGISCLVERRMIEIIETGSPHTPYMKPGDTICIEAFDTDGRSVFGAINQTVTPQTVTPQTVTRQGKGTQ